MNSEALAVTDKEITINLECFINDYCFRNKEIIIDFFSNYYVGQSVTLRATDGVNLLLTGFIEFVDYLCHAFQIDRSKIVVIRHPFYAKFSADVDYAPIKFDQNLSNAKFVGALVVRYTHTRLRLLYELAHAFPGDNFIQCQFASKNLSDQYGNTGIFYQKELEWLDQINNSTHNIESSYPEVWSQFQIEVVAESDVFSHDFITEKTARCLAGGKPFVLVSGPGSLQKLQDMGFVTFNEIIDESYDLAPTPILRIKQLLSNLKVLYNSTDKQDKLKRLYEIAQENIKIYNDKIPI